jgi:hypothetical protein
MEASAVIPDNGGYYQLVVVMLSDLSSFMFKSIVLRR